MNVEHHEGDTPEINSEEEWEEISRLNIKGYANRMCLKILNRAITKEENCMYTTISFIYQMCLFLE